MQGKFPMKDKEIEIMKNKLLKRANGGFSLVELIVVIAIMAILVGVAVPVYSSYIEKTQKSKDTQMIDEIKHAIEIASAAGTFSEDEGGYLVLSTNGVSGVEEGSTIDKILKQTFGNDYVTDLALSYDGWGNSGVIANLTPELASGVAGSSYITGNRAESLLKDVEAMTGTAQRLVAAMNGTTSVTTSFSDLFTPTVLDATAAKYGISKGDYATWEAWADAGNQTAFSNLLVLAAADESEKTLAGTMTEDTSDDYVMSEASAMIMGFSSYYAFAATNPEFSAKLDQSLVELQNKENPTPGECAAWYTALQTTAEQYGYTEYADSEAAGYDSTAFLVILAGLGNPTEEQAGIIKDDINNANLFTQGAVNDMYNTYLGAVQSMNGLGSANITLNDGEIAILFSMKNGTLTIVDTLPVS